MIRKLKSYTDEFSVSYRNLCHDNGDGCAKPRSTLLSSGALTFFAQSITTGTFFTALLIAMGAPESYIGYVAMATTLCMAIQFPAPLIWERMKRRKSALLKLGVLGDVLTYPGLPLIAVLPIDLGWKLTLYMLLTLVTGCIGQFCMPAKNAWTMQSIPLKKRISFTALSSMTQIVINVISVFLAGAFLDGIKMTEVSIFSLSPTLTAIFILRILAFISSLISSLLLAVHVKEFSYGTEHDKPRTSSLSLLIEPIKNRRFISLILIPCIWSMICGMIGNYFSLYLIDSVKMSYTLISSASIISTPIILHDKIVYRDIRTTESDDCRSWTDPQMLRYSTDTEYQMYTNNIMMYPRANHVLIGFPPRLTARYRWTANFDELCGRDRRWDFFNKGNFNTSEPNDGARIALGISDTLFMTSRDTLNWTRYEEAFLSPGPENPKNWLYGGLYLAHGLIETPDIYPGSDNQYSMYSFNNRFFEGPAYLDRYTIRLDGFVSKHAGAREERVVTKPFIFSGREMYLNFATSGNGSVYIAMRTLDGQNSCETCELFGDSCNRRVTFTKFNGSVKDYRLDGFNEPAESSFADMEGKPVYLDIRLRDADIYSFKFE